MKVTIDLLHGEMCDALKGYVDSIMFRHQGRRPRVTGVAKQDDKFLLTVLYEDEFEEDEE